MTHIAKEVVKTSSGEDVPILIEIDDYEVESVWKTRDGKISEITTDAFSQGMKLVKVCAEQIAGTVSSVSKKSVPKKVEVQLAIKLTAEAGAVLAKTKGEAQLQVTMSWS